MAKTELGVKSPSLEKTKCLGNEG